MKKKYSGVFVFNPVAMDVILKEHHTATKGQKVRVIALPMAPPPGTMGQVHIEDAETGKFLGMVSENSLVRAKKGNPRNLPCPTCGKKNKLTPAGRALGYQCDECADMAERRGYGEGE